MITSFVSPLSARLKNHSPTNDLPVSAGIKPLYLFKIRCNRNPGFHRNSLLCQASAVKGETEAQIGFALDLYNCVPWTHREKDVNGPWIRSTVLWLAGLKIHQLFEKRLRDCRQRWSNPSFLVLLLPPRSAETPEDLSAQTKTHILCSCSKWDKSRPVTNTRQFVERCDCFTGTCQIFWGHFLLLMAFFVTRSSHGFFMKEHWC